MQKEIESKPSFPAASRSFKRAACCLTYCVLQFALWGSLFFAFIVLPQATTNTQEGDCRYSSPSVYNSFWDGMPCELTREFYVVYLFLLPVYAVLFFLIYLVKKASGSPPDNFIPRSAVIGILYYVVMLLGADQMTIGYVFKALGGTILALSPLFVFDGLVWVWQRRKQRRPI